MPFRIALRLTLAATAICAGMGGLAVLAQEVQGTQDTQAPQTDATEPGVGENFVATTFNDWDILCNRIDEAGTTLCEMYQLLRDPSDQPIAEISIAALPLGAEFAAGATITTPLETFLPTGLGWHIGNDEEMRLEGFRVCTVVGCVVRMGLSPEEIDRMKAGATATVTIAPFVAIDQPIEITVSLSGFTAAYGDLQTRLAEAAAAARANN